MRAPPADAAMRLDQPLKLIVCILPKGRARRLVKLLVREMGITRIDVLHARGAGRMTPLRHRGVGETTEKDLVHIAVPADQADELFEYIWEAADIHRPHGGLMYMQPLGAASAYQCPALPEAG